MLFAWLLGFSAAQAQDASGGFDAHGFWLAPLDGDPRDALGVHRPGLLEAGDFFASGLMEYAAAPLVQQVGAEPGGPVAREIPVVDALGVLNVSAGIAAHERLRFDLYAPVHGLVFDAGGYSGQPALGDLRLGLTTVVLPPDQGLGIGVGAHLDLPTGAAERFLGRGGPGGGGRVLATAEVERFTTSLDVGVQFDPTGALAGLGGSDTVSLGAAVGALVSDRAAVHLEVLGRAPLEQAAVVGAGTPVEAILSARTRSDAGPFLVGGVGLGLTDAVGVPAVRAFLGGGFGRVAGGGPPDRDPLGFLRISDRCPLEPETVNGFADDDGCPDTLGSLRVTARWAGSPRGGRLVLRGPEGVFEHDLSLAGYEQPAAPGTRWEARVEDACLAGSGEVQVGPDGAELVVDLGLVGGSRVLLVVTDPAGQPVTEAQVRFSTAGDPGCVPVGQLPIGTTGQALLSVGPGDHRAWVVAPGYAEEAADFSVALGEQVVVPVQLRPSAVVLTADRIQILEKVHFETGRAVIRANSFGLLDDVAQVILAHPEIGRVEVAGHTDAQGPDASNLTLSTRRAEAVRTYLMGRGVDPARLLAVGYGETEPVESNLTPEGRESNRRVEFRLVDAPSEKGNP